MPTIRTEVPKLGARQKQIHQWNVEMGWNSKSVIESRGLIYSEVGECVEVHDDTEMLVPELADIVIRCANLAEGLEINLDEHTANASAKPRFLMISPFDLLAYITIPLKNCVNACRKGSIPPEFAISLGEVIYIVFEICEMKKIDILKAIDDKMAVNYARGSRGRII